MTLTLSRRRLVAMSAAALSAPALLTLARGARAQDAPAAGSPGVTTTGAAYTRKIGDLDVTALLDGYLPIDQATFVNITPQELEHSLEAAFLDPKAPVVIGITAHLVRGGGKTVLIDTGVADLFGPNGGRLPAALMAAGTAPDAIDAILLTHMHPDHIGGMLTGGAATFPNATVHVNAVDLAFWTDPAIAAGVPEAVKPFFARAVATVAAYGDRVIPFEGEVEPLPGFSTLPLFGHTPGHTGIRVASGDKQLLIWGDATGVAAVQFAHPEAGLTFDTDAAEAAASRKRVLDMAASDRLLVSGAHMPYPSFGHVVRAGDAFAWTAEDWQYS